METLLLSLRPFARAPRLVRYAATALIVAVAFGLRAALDPQLHAYSLLLFIPAVFLSALLFDRGSGFLATGLSAALAALFFMEPRGSLLVPAGNLLPLGIFIGISIAIAAVTEALRTAVERSVEAERQTSLLLREFAHRTKNNLQMIISLLAIQARSAGNDETRGALDSAVDLVRVIARANDRLEYRKGGPAVEMQQYLEDVCNALGDALRGVRPVVIRVHADPMELPTSDAVSIGLIANELITNALKHAFPGERGGAIEVRFHATGPDSVRLSVSDNGVGCPEDALAGRGTRVVQLLVQQLDGAMERQATEPGCTVVVDMTVGGEDSAATAG